MNKSLLLLVLICLVYANPLNSQGSLLKKVTGAMKDELLGTGGKSSSKQEAEPQCACAQPEIVLDMGGKYKLDYKELEITTMDDGSFLAQDRRTGDYYIIKGGVTQGPYKEGDPRIAGYSNYGGDDNDYMNGLLQRYKGIISKTGDKYTITMGGKSYGPYAKIANFTITPSGDKFACLELDEQIAAEAEGKKMEQAMNNAKSDQERMELAMKYGQQMANKMVQNGGPQSTMAKLVTNVPDANVGIYSGEAGSMVGNSKYDEILIFLYNKIETMQGKTLFSSTPEELFGSEKKFINTDNTKYAYYNYGTLTFSDNKTLSDCFNPHLEKVGGQVYLVYMYYSPKKNAIVQCKIPW
jgi:hypothetical protein